MKTAELKTFNKGNRQSIDRGLSTDAITTTMKKVEKTMGEVKEVLNLNLLVSNRLLTAVEALTNKINPT